MYEVGTLIQWSQDSFITTLGSGVVMAAYSDRIIVKPDGSINTVVVLFANDKNLSLREYIESIYMRSMVAYDISTVYAPYKVFKGYTETPIDVKKLNNP